MIGRGLAILGCALVTAACGGGPKGPAGADGGAPVADGGAPAGADGGMPAPPPQRCASFTAPGAGPRFRDVTTEYGLSDVRGGRVSVGDIDGDGFPDLFVHVIGSHNRADFTRTRDRWPYRVLLNRPREGGGRRFEEHTRASGYGALRDGVPDVGRAAHFAVLGDFDNDGHLDVWSGTYADPTRSDTDPGDRSEVLLNNGDGTFRLAPSQESISGDGRPLPATSATLLDDDRDGRLDVFLGYWFANYTRSYLGVQDRLVQGLGDGTFSEVTGARGLATPGRTPDRADAPRPTYGVTACDLDLDGRTDLLVSVYGRQPNALWLRGADAFRDVGVLSGFAFDERVDFSDNELYRCYCSTTGACTAPAPQIASDAQYWAPGVDDQPWRLGGNTFTTACGDIDNDGRPDLFSAEIAHWHIGSSSDVAEILHNEGPGEDGVPRLRRPGRTATGISVPHPGGWNEGGIGSAIADLDNDDNYLWIFRQKPGGTFEEVGQAAGVRHACAPSFALADLDRDGDLDLIVVSSTMRSWCASRWPDGPAVRIYENLGGQDANWTQIHLEGTGAGGANRSAIGAVVRVTAGGVVRTREVQGGYGHFGMQHDLDVTIGLGATCAIDTLEVRWPDAAGTLERFDDVRANYRLVIRQGEGLRYLPDTRQP
jgi:hypothetical protein